MMLCRQKVRGFTLLEVVVASAVMGVGTLAVFTLYLQLQGQPQALDDRYQNLQLDLDKRPQPVLDERWDGLSCELEAAP